MSTKPEEIKNLRELLKNVVDVSKIIDTKITRLTAPGENYGSLMLKVDVISKTDDNSEDILHLVAKKIPADEVFQKTFNIQVTFKNEIAMYEEVVPILRKFEKENSLEGKFDFIPQFYCGRINMGIGDRIDEDAILILENLVAKGYKNVERIVGFNLESTKLILKDLAEYHAVPLALRIKHPDVFENKLKPYCNDFIFDAGFHQIFWEPTRNILRQNKYGAQLIDKINLIGTVARPQATESFATLVHADLWSNNTMQIFGADKVAVKNKILDFQFLSYGSPAADLFFFVFTSVQLEVLKSHLNTLIEYYHKHFVSILEKCICDITPFSLENFLEEIKRQCLFEIGHAAQFILFIVKINKALKDIKFPDEIDRVSEAISQKAKDQVWFLVEECHRRENTT